MKIFLHIGSDKTGSTSIQRHIAVNKEWFHSHSVYIPNTGFGAYNGHSQLLSELDSDDLAKLSAELEAAYTTRYKFALLSWEGMNFYDEHQITRLHNAIKNHHISIVVYFREQAEIIQTGLLQELKANRNNTHLHIFDREEVLTHTAVRETSFYKKNRDYYAQLKKWQDAIPNATFFSSVFSRQTLLNNDVVCDFLDQIGLSEDKNFQRETGDLNHSLDVESGILVEDWQRQGLTSDTIARLTDIARSVIRTQGAGAKHFLSESSVALLRKAYARSNKKLGKTFFEKNGSPFTELQSCWRQEAFEGIQKRAAILGEKIAFIDRTPTLKTAIVSERISRETSLYHGWSGQEKWGVWSTGEHSGLRFRLMHTQLRYDVSAVKIIIHGRYHGENSRTHVTINGIDFGEQQLLPSHPGMEVPVNALLPHEGVEVILHHQNPSGPRAIAFGLKKVSRQLVRKGSA